MTTARRGRNDYATSVVVPALNDLFEPDTVTEIVRSEAFGALVYRIREYCAAHDDVPRALLGALDERHLDFVPDADDPAAFLAAKIRDLG